LSLKSASLPSGRGVAPQIVAVSTTARQKPSSHPVPFRCVSDHMVITNAQHLTFTYSHFRYYIPLLKVCIPTGWGRLSCTLGVGRETFGLSLVPPLETATQPAHTQDYYCSLIREYILLLLKNTVRISTIHSELVWLSEAVPKTVTQKYAAHTMP
jgi:hypothetical protein